MTWRHVDNVHWCCSLSTDVSVLTHRKGTCRVLLLLSAAGSWRQHHDSDRCAAVFVISFVSTVPLFFASCRRHRVLMHAGVRPALFGRFFGSHRGQNAGYPDWGFRGITQSLQVNVGIVPLLGQEFFLPNPFQYYGLQSDHSKLYRLATHNVSK
jgi:hypothetical protein